MSDFEVRFDVSLEDYEINEFYNQLKKFLDEFSYETSPILVVNLKNSEV